MKLFKVRVGEKYVAAYYRDNKKATTTCYSFLQTKDENNEYDKYYRAMFITDKGLTMAPYFVGLKDDTGTVILHGTKHIYPSLAKGFIEFLTRQYVVPVNDEAGNYKFYIRDKD